MILAAGIGRRLRPITNREPKALVKVGGKPMLEWVAERLVEAGADRLIINLHHFPEEIRSYVDARGGFGVEVRFSLEALAPLDTGGGLAFAASHFRCSAPFFLHNCDIITEIDLADLYRAHQADPEALVTLAAGGRESWRYLVFDDFGLCGHGNDRTGERTLARAPEGATRNLPFAGVHVADPELLDHITESGTFSIISTYLRLAREGIRIVPYDIGDALWLEIGNPERLARARTWAGETSAGAPKGKGAAGE
jgi:MurNAc alpha-1-phosphate uridylyltransferase